MSKEYELELTEESIKLVEEYAKKSGKSEEEVVDYILFEFLEKQASIIEKKAKELDRPVGELMHMQFVRILEALLGQVN